MSENSTKRKMVKFVFVSANGKEHTCDLPVDQCFNDGTGQNFYKRRGFYPHDEYMAKKHAEEVSAKREAEIAKREADLKAAEAKLKAKEKKDAAKLV